MNVSYRFSMFESLNWFIGAGFWKLMGGFDLRWPLSFIWEIHWRWFVRPVDDLQENPPNLQCAVAPTDFQRLANWRGGSWPSMWLQLDDLEAKIWENFMPLFFHAQNSVGQQQHSTIWGWDADPAVLFRWWLRIAVPCFCPVFAGSELRKEKMNLSYTHLQHI